MIHSTAVVDPGARVAPDVEVGPYAVIGPNVEVGQGCRIGPHAVITGHTRIGRENRIFQFASVGDAPQDKKYGGEPTRLEIGDGNIIREFCTLNTGTVQGGGLTRIGDDNLFMAYAHVAHDCVVGSHTVFANCATLGGHVRTGIGPIAPPDKLQFAPGLPKTRSGKIMRRILRKIAHNEIDQLGDTSTLLDPAVVDILVKGKQ